MALNQNTYLTEIQFTGKSEEKKNSVRQSQQAITFHEQPSHKKRFASAMKYSRDKKLQQQKIYTKFLHESYYETKKVKPGLSILKMIIEGEQKRSQKQKVPQLFLNIPETVLFTDNSYQLLCTQKEGSVKMINDISFQKWLQILRQKKENIIFPAALQLLGGSIQTDHSVIMSNDLGQKIMPKSETQAILKYPTPYGLYPNVMRLFYFPTGTRTMKKSFGYKLINKNKINQELLSKKHKLIHFFIIDTNREDSFTAILVKGKALDPLQKMTQSLVSYLEQLKGVKISQIIIDFTFDNDRIYWFTEVLSIKSTNLNQIWDVGTDQQIISFSQQQNNYIRCRLCGFSFTKNEVKKQITNKLIAELIIHLKNRGKYFPIEVPLNKQNLSGYVNVCQICFDLILAEHNLINVEHEFCKLINISSNPIQRVPLLENANLNENKKLNKKQSSPEKTKKTDIFNLIEGITPNLVKLTGQCMHQWRIFFYIEKIKNVPRSTASNYSLAMKFKDKTQTYRQKIIGGWKLDTGSSSRVKSAISNKRKVNHMKQNSLSESVDSLSRKKQVKKSTFPTHYTNRTHQVHFTSIQSKLTLNLEKIKVLVFYSKEESIKRVLEEDLKFQLSIGSQVYKGSSSTLQIFGNKKSCQRHSCEILLFDEKYNYCNLQLNIGLVCDGLTNIENMQLYESEDNSIFYPGRILGNCNPLPDEWMQILISDEMKENYASLYANWKEKL